MTRADQPGLLPGWRAPLTSTGAAPTFCETLLANRACGVTSAFKTQLWSRRPTLLFGVGRVSMRPQVSGDVPVETVRVARAAFPKGSLAIRVRDELGVMFQDEDFTGLFPARGKHAWSPGRLAVVLVLQFVENLTDRQAAEAVRARIDWKYALGLELTDAGFDYSVLSEFRVRRGCRGCRCVARSREGCLL